MPAHLSIFRPSPTTVSFTVSNAPARTTLSSKFTFCIQILLRLVAFLVVLAVDVAKARNHSFFNSWVEIDGDGGWSPSTWLGEEVWWESVVGAAACRVADGYQWQVVAAASVVVLYVVFRKGYTEESLLVLRGMGIQTSTSSATYWSSASTRFIPTTQIQDIVIHEAFKGFEVRFYLAIIVEGESDVVVVFPNLLPKRMILEEVWRGARRCLYDQKS